MELEMLLVVLAVIVILFFPPRRPGPTRDELFINYIRNQNNTRSEANQKMDKAGTDFLQNVRDTTRR
jgi:hypothetical protein